MLESEGKVLISPATTPTPGSTVDADVLVIIPYFVKALPVKLPWYKRYPPPYAVISISILQIFVFVITDDEVRKDLRYEPAKQRQLWRFLTYMFVHTNLYHLLLNVAIQNLFAVMLERDQGRRKVIFVYFGGGAFGALGASCIRPDRIIGASAGVYALLTSHLAHIILNFYNTKYKICHCACTATIIASDVIYNLIHASFHVLPVISWGAHGAGASTGLFLGLVTYKSLDVKNCGERERILRVTGLFLLLFQFVLLGVFDYQIRKCNFARNGVNYFVYWC